MTPAFCCLLDESRLPVLKALLAEDGGDVLSSSIPRSTFVTLAKRADIDVGDDDIANLMDPLPLPWAAIHLGNFDAFALLTERLKASDDLFFGLLHLAALLALPRFVAKLLETHDPNDKEEEFDHWIPLAMACQARDLPWNIIANAEDDFRTRQKETMTLLAGKTDCAWRHRGRTVLHIALESGLETTRALVEALDVRADPARHTKYNYVDRAGRSYSPAEYVAEFVGTTDAEKAPLMDCLRSAKLLRSTWAALVAEGHLAGASRA